MPQSQSPGWQQTLAEVEEAVGHCLAALDRYEKAFDAVLQSHRTEPTTPPTVAASQEQMTGWEERLSLAREQADAVEALLDQQEAEWKAWQTKYAAWRQSLEQPPK